jgi:hypothetical protein
MHPKEVFNKDGVKVVLIGKTKKKHNCLVFLVMMRDKLDRKWCSGKIFLANELINDPGIDHLQLLVELGKESMHNGIKAEINEN